VITADIQYIQFMQIALQRKRIGSIGLFTILIICIVSLSHLYAQRQNYRFAHLTINDGLSQNSINGIVQDDLGFTWIATQDGLDKYDGYSIKQFRNNPDDFNTISDNNISSIYKDPHGDIWIGSENGNLSRCNPWLEEFHNFGNIAQGYGIRTIIQINDELWCGTWGGGIFIYNTINYRTTQISKESSNVSGLLDDHISDIYLDGGNVIWVGTHDGGVSKLIRREHNSIIFKNFSHLSGNVESLSHDEINTIYEDSKGNIWIATVTGLDKLLKDRDSFVHYKTEHPISELFSVNAMVELTDEKFVVSFQNGGIAFFNPKLNYFEFYAHDNTNPTSLGYDAVNNLYIDKNGLIWIGTWGGGVDWFNPDPDFIHYTSNANNTFSIAHHSVRSILLDESNNLWVASYGGLDKFDRTTNSHSHYYNSEKYLSNINVYSLFSDKNTLWIGTEGGGLNKLDKKSGQFSHFRHYGEEFPGNDFIFTLASNSERYLWLGSYLGIELFDRIENEFITINHQENFPEILSSSAVHALSFDRDNNLWVGTDDNGLFKLSLIDTTIIGFEKYQFASGKINGISSNRIKHVFQDSKGKIWIGTNGGGLNQFQQEDKSFKVYSERDGLSNNVVYGILEDDEGDLWMSTNKGLAVFNPANETFTNYTTIDGIQGNEFNTASFHKGHDGLLYFGGINGVTSFDPLTVKSKNNEISVRFTNLLFSNTVISPGDSIDGNSNLKKPIYSTEKIKFGYNIGQVTFRFSALTYTNPNLIHYAYMLKGLDATWTYTSGEKHYATYTHLPSGEFDLLVKAKTHHEIEYGPTTSLFIAISTPFWKTWWAYTVYILCFISIIASVIKRQISKHTLELQRKQELVEHLQKIGALERDTIKNQEKYLTLFHQSRDAIFISTSVGQLVDINPSCKKIFEIQDEDIKNYNLFDFI